MPELVTVVHSDAHTREAYRGIQSDYYIHCHAICNGLERAGILVRVSPCR